MHNTRDSRTNDPVESDAATHCIDVPWLTRLNDDATRGERCLDGTTRLLKRWIDVLGAIVLLLMTWPVMVLSALLIKLTSRGPVIFKQVRVGLNRRGTARERRAERGAGLCAAGERRRHTERRNDPAYGSHFTLYKLRTMRTDAEKHGAQFAVKGDPRVTPLGRFLRKTRIDELPQLWNVLQGDMSLVGPRPERPEFVGGLTSEIPDYPERLALKPGLTGVAQILNGYDNTVEGFRRKVGYDLLYLQNCCCRNDIKVLWRTVGVVLTGSGAL